MSEEKGFFQGIVEENHSNGCEEKNVTSAVSVCVCVCPVSAPVPLRLARPNSAGRQARSKAGVFIQSTAHNAASLNMTSTYNLDFLPEMMVEGRLLSAGERM